MVFGQDSKGLTIPVTVAALLLVAFFAVSQANRPMENFRNGLNAVVGKTEQAPYDVIEEKQVSL